MHSLLISEDPYLIMCNMFHSQSFSSLFPGACQVRLVCAFRHCSNALHGNVSLFYFLHEEKTAFQFPGQGSDLSFWITAKPVFRPWFCLVAWMRIYVLSYGEIFIHVLDILWSKTTRCTWNTRGVPQMEWISSKAADYFYSKWRRENLHLSFLGAFETNYPESCMMKRHKFGKAKNWESSLHSQCFWGHEREKIATASWKTFIIESHLLFMSYHKPPKVRHSARAVHHIVYAYWLILTQYTTWLQRECVGSNESSGYT